jgi:hypothetical protein
MATQPTTRLGTQPTSAVFGYAARSRWTTVRIETARGVYEGRVFIPDGKKRLSEVLCDNRPFLNLAEATFDGSGVVEPYVAINKTFIQTVRVLHEGESDLVPIRALQ